MTLPTRPLLLRAVFCAAGLAVPLPGPASAQVGAAASPEAGGSMALYSTLGPYARTITTASSEAQAYFTQGMQLMYAFDPDDAARSFQEAQGRDPGCAMCYWGEAWARGPYLNGPMSESDAPRAHAAVRRAQALAANATEVERALIQAMAVRYEPEHDAERRAALDSAYARAMESVWAAYPADLDVGTLYGESLMLLEPRRGNWDIERPEIRRIHRVLEGVLALHLQHPGACHLYVHATESTTEPGKAEACAEYLGSAIPGASHINHMPSHTYNRIGRWGDAVRANIEAWHSDQRAKFGEAFAIYPSHNLHMLLFAASMDGQGAIAIQAGKDYAKLVPDGVFYRSLTLLRFGRFDAILEIEERPAAPLFAGVWEFARGYAHLRLERPDSARAYLESVRGAAETLPDSVQFRGHTAAQLLGVLGGILEGELLAAEGRYDEAAGVMERAVEIEDGLRYDEPEPLNLSARHYLGAVLLEAGLPLDAEHVYRAALEDHPRNGWCLFGLAQALEAQGKAYEAARVRDEFERSWRRADVWLRSSRF